MSGRKIEKLSRYLAGVRRGDVGYRRDRSPPEPFLALLDCCWDPDAPGGISCEGDDPFEVTIWTWDDADDGGKLFCQTVAGFSATRGPGAALARGSEARELWELLTGTLRRLGVL